MYEIILISSKSQKAENLRYAIVVRNNCEKKIIRMEDYRRRGGRERKELTSLRPRDYSRRFRIAEFFFSVIIALQFTFRKQTHRRLLMRDGGGMLVAGLPRPDKLVAASDCDITFSAKFTIIPRHNDIQLTIHKIRKIASTVGGDRFA